ncbi:MAG TPA: hypothetical protein VFE33_26590 [Thermoanaerobaculia bacterium]|nr:hypothetical protein [Thermoanaerobaculia bacterium]
MRKVRAVLLALSLAPALPALAHVTPNVELLKKGEFVQQSLPGATRFLEQKLTFGGGDLAAVKKATGWTPSEEDVRIYVGRNAQGERVGTVVLLWMASEHGPVGVGVAFGGDGKILRAAVTDIGSEPLAWVRPLLQGDGLATWNGLALDTAPDAAKVAPQVTGRMSRYYAEVIAQGVARAQAVERVSLTAAK